MVKFYFTIYDLTSSDISWIMFEAVDTSNVDYDSNAQSLKNIVRILYCHHHLGHIATVHVFFPAT